MNITVSKLVVKGTEIYAKLLWHKHDSSIFDIQLFDDQGTWSGSFLKETAQTFIEGTGLPANEYYDELKSAFEGKSNDFQFDLVNNKFIWKKLYHTTRITLGSVQLEKTDLSKDSLINYLLEENKDNQEKIIKFKDENEKLNNELNAIKTEMINLRSVKDDMENVLYTKFVHLLNCKKEIIQIMEEKIAKAV